MSDVLELAARRRARFQREIARLDAFIALGEQIVRTEDRGARPTVAQATAAYASDSPWQPSPHVLR